MSLTKNWAVNADSVARFSSTAKTGSGGSKHLYVGKYGTFTYRSFLKFALDWADVGTIVSAQLYLYTDDFSGLMVAPTAKTKPALKVQRLTAAFADGTAGDNVFTSADYVAPAATTTGQVAFTTLQRAANGVNVIDITDIVNQWAPSTVRQSNGQPGLAVTNYGVRLVEYSTTYPTNWSGWSNHSTDPGSPGDHPLIVLTYEEGLTTPNVPANLVPTGSVGVVASFQGDFSDTRTADTITSSEVEVYSASATNVGQVVTGTKVFQRKQDSSTTEISNARFVMPPTGWVQIPATYKWRARYTDSQGQTSLWTDLQSVTVTNTPPSAPTLTPDASAYNSLNNVIFRGGTFSDADGDTLAAYQVQLALLAPGSSDWDNGDFLRWDTGKTFVPLGQTTWQTPYSGSYLNAGAYHWRARQWDSRDGVSAWTYAAVTLTSDFTPLPGSQTFQQIDKKTPWRIVIKGMSGDGKRGPGTTLAVIENAKSVGASVLFNSPGELHFTLPVDHPQISVIEPKQTHYSLQLYSGDGWRETFAGLIWDYDANETGVIFYGIDYLALFDYVVDERFDPANIDKPTTSGGSKYLNQTITTIVSQSLALAIATPNSPVGFLTLGSVAPMSEGLTIWSTFQPTLAFVTGLLDSHRQGTGKRTRVSVQATTTGYQVIVEDDPGVQRDNLRLKYGELVQGYRVVPFGKNWASRALLIGRSRDGTLVRYKTASAPGIDQSIWGSLAQVSYVDNLADENDANRRVLQQAIHNGKLGNQIGLGIRSGILGPLNGYDICDTIPVVIQHGAVDTTRFGSGYWAIMGLAWETGDNASTNTILTLLPREDSTPPNPDLIPAQAISTQQEWQVGWLPPDPTFVQSRFYLDQSTGIIYYRLDDGTYAIYIDAPVDTKPVPGGHNVILNSGFELGGYATAPSFKLWTAAADWNSGRFGSDDNVTTNAGSLDLSSNTY